MLHDIVVVHRQNQISLAKYCQEPNWYLWQTCLRQLIFSREQQPTDFLSEADNVLSGREAYAFALEVICGLRSPILGETEVFGQFKKFSQQFSADCAQGRWMHQLSQMLISDVKHLRQNYLTGMGSQSYGSVLRKFLRDYNEVHILGAGQLVKDILPWVAKNQKKIFVYCRDEKKAQADLLSVCPKVEILNIQDKTRQTCAGENKNTPALIVAAPLVAEELQNWIADSWYGAIADLRADSSVAKSDSPENNSPQSSMRLNFLPEAYLTLPEVFKQIEATRSLQSSQIEKITQAINDCVTKRFQQVEHRPYGWEDICA